MKAYGRTINLKDDPEIIRRYRAYHAAVWPEVARGLQSIGITRMRIWLLGRRLFMLMETVDDFDAERDFARYMRGEPRIREWQALMESFQEPVPDAKAGEWWADMELVFDLGAG